MNREMNWEQMLYRVNYLLASCVPDNSHEEPTSIRYIKVDEYRQWQNLFRANGYEVVVRHMDRYMDWFMVMPNAADIGIDKFYLEYLSAFCRLQEALDYSSYRLVHLEGKWFRSMNTVPQYGQPLADFIRRHCSFTSHGPVIGQDNLLQIIRFLEKTIDPFYYANNQLPSLINAREEAMLSI